MQLLRRGESRRPRRAAAQARRDPVHAQRHACSRAATSASRARRSRSSPPTPRPPTARSLFGDEVEALVGVRPADRRGDRRRPRARRDLAGDPLQRRRAARTSARSPRSAPSSSERCAELESEGKLLEAHRLRQRTQYDMEMLREVGFCSGIENYSRILDGRQPGERPYCLIDYFPRDFVCFIDESHQTIPQIGGMYEGDRSRKQTLVDYGFRLPSALDNRPQTFEEFLRVTPQIVLVSATPGEFERTRSGRVVEQIVRPTGIVDPQVEVRATRNQIDDLMREVRLRVDRDERVLVTTLTKKMAEDLSGYLLELGFRARYLHSEIDTLERIQIIRDAAAGRVRRARRRQPAARGPRPARGLAGRDPRRRQGGLPARRDLADPDDRPRRAQRRGHGDHVRRPRDRRRCAPRSRRPTAAARSSSPTTRSTASPRRRSSRASATSPTSSRRESKTPKRRRRAASKTDELAPHELEKLAVELEEEMLAGGGGAALRVRGAPARRAARAAPRPRRRQGGGGRAYGGLGACAEPGSGACAGSRPGACTRRTPGPDYSPESSRKRCDRGLLVGELVGELVRVLGGALEEVGRAQCSGSSVSG